MIVSNNMLGKEKSMLYNKNKSTSSKRVSFGMKEDFFAKTRNGHLLKDTFDKITNSLDIYSTGLYPANVLSNLAYKPFIFDGIQCASLEGFLQSLKTNIQEEQQRICQLYGGSARKMSKKNTQWLNTLKLYWRGKEYNRLSSDYIQLLESAYMACYEQNPIFQKALQATLGIKLTHTDGKVDPNTTIITRDEFINILTKLRDSRN